MARAWVIWVLSAFFMCYKYAIEVSPSVMTDQLMQEFSLSGGQMGNLAASYFYAYLLLQIPAGLLIDRWGPRRITTSAIILCSIGTFLFSTADTYLLAFIGRFITGVGSAFAFVNCLKLVANWFPSHRFALMAGLIISVGMLGAVAGQAPLASFIHFLGWRNALGITAFGGLILAALFLFIVQDTAPPYTTSASTSNHSGIFKNFKTIIMNPQSWCLAFYAGFTFAPHAAFGGLWGVPFLTKVYSMPAELAAKGTSLIFLGVVVGAPFLGWLSSYIGKRRPVMFWGTLIAGLCLAAILYYPEVIAPFIFIVLFLLGFSISASLLCFTVIKELHHVGLAASAIGFVNAFAASFGALSDPITGKILDLWWTGAYAHGARVFSEVAYQYAFSILIIYSVLSLSILNAIRETNGKESFPSPMP